MRRNRMWNLKATYKGWDQRLVGKTALVRKCTAEHICVQFDDLALEDVAHGWHTFPRAHFTEPVRTEWDDGDHRVRCCAADLFWQHSGQPTPFYVSVIGCGAEDLMVTNRSYIVKAALSKNLVNEVIGSPFAISDVIPDWLD